MLTRNKPRAPARRGSLLASIAAGTYQSRAARMAVIGAEVARPKSEPVRDEAYRRWVAALPCMACGVHGFSQAAHANQGKGLGMKVCDLRTFPLCAPHDSHMGCHSKLDTSFGMTREMRRELEDEYVERTQSMARKSGWAELLRDS